MITSEMIDWGQSYISCGTMTPTPTPTPTLTPKKEKRIKRLLLD